ncbi:hypothetical protein JCM33374_g5282 [Metschnikowia sp. JCM 33374]|nr:hypothetical protein JCM33374_g5282 [Metschnikowia sp. JCM 33374]
MSKVTPNKKSPKLKVGNSSSTKKQSSLLSFFKPVAAKSQHNLSSSPLKAKSVFPESEKELDTSILTMGAETLLTSDPDAMSGPASAIKKPHPQDMRSSPVKAPKDKYHISREEDLEAQEKSALTPTVSRQTNLSPGTGSNDEKDEPITDIDQKENVAPTSHKQTKPKQTAISKRGRKKNAVSYAESDASDASDSENVPVQRKRRRVVDSEDEDEPDFQPDHDEDDDDHMSDFVVEESDHSAAEDDIAENSDDEPISKKAPVRKSKNSSPKASSSSSLGSKFTANSSYVSTQPAVAVKPAPKPAAAKKSFEKENEERYQWLVNIKDAEKRPVDHPDYDSRTLFIPSSAWAKFTAFEKQYWEIKSKMWDTVVFFKKGKFYELYENDAMIANTKFDLKIAGGGRANMKLAGVPEMSFEYWAKEFISLGYKVAKVDQKESMLAKEMRGGGSKEEKIIKRELTGILTGGTLTDMDMIKDDMATFCMAIKESTSTTGEKVFGVCFVDTATSELNFIELVDDDECTKLDTLITQIKPKEVLCEKHNLCSTAVKAIKYSAHNSHQIWNNLNPYSEFWDYDTTVERLVESKYYPGEDLDDYSNYPEVLLKFKGNHHTAFSAFGGLLYYLRSLKLDDSIMTLKNMKEYQISKSSASHMLLDGVTLNNLEILNNTFDGGDKGTLFKLLNKAITPFGKRLMKNWVLYPLMEIDQINSRYDAVEFLMNHEPELRVSLETALNKLPDLERLIARVHSKTLKFKDFLKVIEGFETISKSSRS